MVDIPDFESDKNKKLKDVDFDSFIASFSSIPSRQTQPPGDAHEYQTEEKEAQQKDYEALTEFKTAIPAEQAATADSILSTFRSKKSLALAPIFKEVLERNASDLHLSSGYPPILRINGDLYTTSYSAVTDEDIKNFIFSILVPEQIESFHKYGDLDFSYEEPGIARFRVNSYKKINGMSASFRIIPSRISAFEELHLPEIIRDIADYKKGLVLITGPTGSGKTTTLASIIDIINKKRKAHIITIEDPLEFVHENKASTITHREIGTQTINFGEAIRSAMRSDPDVILVGEMRDLETVSESLKAAETGVLVLTTLHTNSAAKAIDRLIDMFPPANQMQVRAVLGEVLRAVIAQRLLKRADKRGRIPAVEMLFATAGLDNIIREGKTSLINSIIQTGREEGMISMDQALIRLIEDGIISKQSAKEIVQDHKTFERAGIFFE